MQKPIEVRGSNIQISARNREPREPSGSVSVSNAARKPPSPLGRYRGTMNRTERANSSEYAAPNERRRTDVRFNPGSCKESMSSVGPES
jgi:hypothetical protein